MLKDFVSHTDKELAYGPSDRGNSHGTRYAIRELVRICGMRVRGRSPDVKQNISFYAFITEYRDFQVDFSQKI
jgi:hypothetical protein